MLIVKMYTNLFLRVEIRKYIVFEKVIEIDKLYNKGIKFIKKIGYKYSKMGS